MLFNTPIIRNCLDNGYVNKYGCRWGRCDTHFNVIDERYNETLQNRFGEVCDRIEGKNIWIPVYMPITHQFIS